MARKNNLIELTLEVKRKGTEQIGKYKKELFELKKAANDLNKTLNATQKQLKQDVQNTSVKALSKDSEKSQAQIKKLQAALTKVTQELKDQKKAQSDLRRESNAKIQEVKAGAKAEIKAYKDSEKALKKKKKEEEDANKQTKKSATSLSALGNAAATVNGPLNDISGRINSLATGLKNFDKGLILLGTGLAALTFALPGALRQFSQMESQLLRIDGLLKQTGNSSGFTVQQFEDLAQELAFGTLASLTEVRDSIGLLLSFPNIRTENFERVLELSQDIAEVTRRDLKSATEQVAKAVTDPIKGITKLTEVGVVFTEEQENLIRSTQAAEGTFAAQGVILDVLAGQYGGSAKRAAQGFAGVIDTIGQLVENMNTAFGEAAENSAFINFISEATQGLQLLLDARSYGGAEEFLERLEQLRTGSITLNQALNDLDKTIGRIQDERVQNIGVDITSDESESALEKQAKRQKEELDNTINEIAQLKASGEEVPKELVKQAEEQAAGITQSLVETRKQISAAFEFQTGEIGEKLVGKKGLQRSREELDEFANLAQRAGISLDEIELSDGVISKPLRRELSATERELTELRKKGVQEAGKFGKTYTEEQKKRIAELKKRYDELYLQLGNAAAAQIRNLQQGAVALADAGANVSELGLKAAIDSKQKAIEEEKRIEEQRAKDLKRLREESNEQLLSIELRKKQDEISIQQELVNRQLRQDTDNVTLQNEKLSLQSQKEVLSLKVRELELEKERNKAIRQANELRAKNPDLSDKAIEKITADSDQPFTKTLGVIERTNKELDNTRDKIKNIRTSAFIEQEINIEINTKRINDQINTFIEDNNIKQKELSARLQGDTEESLENQLSVIDDKYDKALTNLEERIGKIPDNVLKEAADSKALEKANTTFDNVNKRFKNLTEEFKDGKVSVDSYIASVNELNKTLRETGQGVGIEIQENDALEGIQEGIKPRTDEAADDIQKILDKVEDADLSEGFELRKSALDRLREYSQELIRIKELNPEIDISDAVAQIKDLEKEIQNTYTLTEQIFRKMADDFASTFSDEFTKMVTEGGVSFRDMLKKSIAEAFGNYATDRLRDMVFNGIRSGLSAISNSEALGGIFNELNFGEYFDEIFGNGSLENKEEYKIAKDAFTNSLIENNNRDQKVFVSNSSDIKSDIVVEDGKARDAKKDKDDKKSGDSTLSGNSLTLAPVFAPSLQIGDRIDNSVTNINELSNALGNLKDTQLAALANSLGNAAEEGDETAKSLQKLTEETMKARGLDPEKEKEKVKSIDSQKEKTDSLVSAMSKLEKSALSAASALSSVGSGKEIETPEIDVADDKKNDEKGSKKEETDANDEVAESSEKATGALQNFAGELGGFAKTLLGDIATGFLSGGSGGLGGSLLGLAGGFFHDGGIVGSGGSSVMMSPSLLKNAKYFHDGGYTGSNLKNDEMAAILQKGEYVIDRKTTSDLLKKGPSGGSGSQVNITNNFGPDELAQSLSGNRISQDNIVNDIKARTSEIKNYLDR